jgi:hypothetical protein
MLGPITGLSNVKFHGMSGELQGCKLSRSMWQLQTPRQSSKVTRMRGYPIPIPPNTITSRIHAKSTSTSPNGLLITKLIRQSLYVLCCLASTVSFNRYVQNFLPTLKDHLLGRIAETPEAGFTDRDRRQLLIHNNQIFCHKTLRVNFTTYNCRRDQDTINTRTHSDVMVLANQEEDNANQHPYWYARMVSIFHAMVSRVGSGSTYERMDFLWVRWYGLDTAVRSGFKA